MFSYQFWQLDSASVALCAIEIPLQYRSIFVVHAERDAVSLANESRGKPISRMNQSKTKLPCISRGVLFWTSATVAGPSHHFDGGTASISLPVKTIGPVAWPVGEPPFGSIVTA